jgi:hypothetical protein
MNHAPSDDVLRELGRIVWEAITLEDRVYQVAGHVFLDPDDDPVGTCITKTIKKLGRLGQHPDLDMAIAWLEEARLALDDRNAVMHGIPMRSFERSPGGTLTPNGASAIEYLGRRHRTVGRVIPLEVDGMQQISSRLANVNARWQTVTIGVSQFRDVPWGPNPNSERLGRS